MAFSFKKELIDAADVLKKNFMFIIVESICLGLGSMLCCMPKDKIHSEKSIPHLVRLQNTISEEPAAI